jgi:phosphate transport system substrate-binding protein
VVNPQNDWVKSITVAQLRKIWEAESKVKMWSDVDPSWPKEQIKLFGPTSDHGSYEYFNEVINGDKKNSRQDYSQNNDYNALVQGIVSNKGALGYVGHAYVVQNEGTIKAVPVDSGTGAVTATNETILNGTYAPLSRPLLIYVRKDSAERPEVKAFVDYALDAGAEFIGKSGYVPFSKDLYAKVAERFAAGTTGSMVQGAKGKTVSDLLGAK